MSAPGIIVAALVRAVVYALLFFLIDASFVRTDLSTDALAFGLLLIAAGFVVTFVWSLIDGVRRGFVTGLMLWAVATVLIGLAIGILASLDVVVDEGTTDLLAGMLGAVLIISPAALIGVAVGGLVHRLRRSDRPA